MREVGSIQHPQSGDVDNPTILLFSHRTGSLVMDVYNGHQCASTLKRLCPYYLSFSPADALRMAVSLPLSSRCSQDGCVAF